MWEIVLLAGFGSLFAMARYRATHVSNLARHPIRSAILEIVKRQPGINLADLRRELQCSWGTVHHHIHMLSRERLVRTQRWHRSRRVFPAKLDQDQERPLMLLQHGRIREIVQEICERPGIIQREITDGLGVSRKVLRGYVDMLKQEGLLQEVPSARTRQYFPTPELRKTLGRLDGAPSTVEISAAGHAERDDRLGP